MSGTDSARARGAPAHDFRSDTVTRPTPAMYEAMRRAELGDDVFGDDPTVAALEAEVAERLGKEAALFVPSGTMANSIAIAVSTRPGDEAIMMEDAHTFLFEAGGCARLWGVQTRTLAAERGAPTPEAVESLVRGDDVHFPRTSLLCLENTHNMQAGIVVAPERIAALGEVCRRHGMQLHLDGARLFNAAVASGRTPRDFASAADTVSVCLSKGLSCPVGSLLAGTRERMREARRVRKVLGGGMRQAGVLAACGRVALREQLPLLAQDHERARRLAAGLARLPGVRVSPEPVETNILMVEVSGAEPGRYRRFQTALAREGILIVNILDRRLRFVTHREIGDDAIAAALAACARVFSAES